MKKCPFCGAEIEASAQFCLYCMEPLGEKEPVFPNRKKRLRWVLIPVLFAVAVVLGILVLPNMWKPISEEPDIGSTSSGKRHSVTYDPTETGTAGTVESTILPTAEPAVSVATEPPVPATSEPIVPSTTAPTAPSVTEPTAPPTPAPTAPPVTEESHSHDYFIENTAEEYLKEAATCTSRAVYYYSCSCGQKGTATFTYGKKAAHTPQLVPGYSPTCTTFGKTDGQICAVCKDTLHDAVSITCQGHTYALGDTPSPCLDCGEIGTVVVLPPEFPVYLDDTYRVDSCTFSIRPLSKTSKSSIVWVNVTYTNISSERQSGECSKPSLYVPRLAYWVPCAWDSPSEIAKPYKAMDPNESASVMFCLVSQLEESDTTLTLGFNIY